MDTAVIIVGIVALALGALIGWLFASRAARRRARQTVDTLRLQLDEVVKERDANRSAASELAAVRARPGRARPRSPAATGSAAKRSSREIGSKLLGEAQEQFLEAGRRALHGSPKRTSGQELKALLQPVHERLKRYERSVQKVEENGATH